MSTAQCISLKNTLKYEVLHYFMRGGSLFFQKALGIEHNCSALPYPLPYPLGVPLSPVLGAATPAWGVLYLAIRSAFSRRLIGYFITRTRLAPWVSGSDTLSTVYIRHILYIFGQLRRAPSPVGFADVRTVALISRRSAALVRAVASQRRPGHKVFDLAAQPP